MNSYIAGALCVAIGMLVGAFIFWLANRISDHDHDKRNWK